MTKIHAWECDYCGFTDKQDDPNMEVEIKQCFVCNKDFCDQCWNDHALEECFG